MIALRPAIFYVLARPTLTARLPVALKYRRVMSEGIFYRHSSPPSPSPSSSPSSTNEQGRPLEQIKAVIFDMDGTLTIPVLDFLEMRSKIGLRPDQDILPTVQGLPPPARARAMAIIEDLEEEGVRKMELQPGTLALLGFIAKAGVRRALMTRNSSQATEVFLSRLRQQLSVADGESCLHLTPDAIFSQVLTRDYEPCKPDPAPALHICHEWSLEPRNVAIVGDDKCDMLCGQRAELGVRILLKNQRNKGHEVFSHFAVDSLMDIVSLFSSPMNVITSTS